MKSFLTLAFAAVLFAAAVGSETHGSDLLGIGDDGWYRWQVEGTEALEIYAEVEDGRPTELIVTAWRCGKHHYPEAEDLGVARGQIGVDRHEVGSPPRQRIQV